MRAGRIATACVCFQDKLSLNCCAQVTHIQQIKALCPEALGWEHILAVNPASKKQEQQLLLKLPVDAGKTKQSADTAQMQQLFFKRLQQHMMKHRVSQRLWLGSCGVINAVDVVFASLHVQACCDIHATSFQLLGLLGLLLLSTLSL